MSTSICLGSYLFGMPFSSDLGIDVKAQFFATLTIQDKNDWCWWWAKRNGHQQRLMNVDTLIFYGFTQNMRHPHTIWFQSDPRIFRVERTAIHDMLSSCIFIFLKLKLTQTGPPGYSSTNYAPSSWRKNPCKYCLTNTNGDTGWRTSDGFRSCNSVDLSSWKVRLMFHLWVSTETLLKM